VDRHGLLRNVLLSWKWMLTLTDILHALPPLLIPWPILIAVGIALNDVPVAMAMLADMLGMSGMDVMEVISILPIAMIVKLLVGFRRKVGMVSR
jgi:hypothetical protein